MKIQDVFNLIVESGVGRFSGAGIIFFDGKSVLLLKKTNSRWCFPGGKPVQGETPLQTAKREAKEEIGKCPGHIVSELKFELDERTFHSFISKVNKPFEVNISDEHSDYTWIHYKRIRDFKLHKNIFRSLKTVERKLKELEVE